MSGTALHREIQKIIQNLFVIKSHSPLSAKSAAKCPPMKKSKKVPKLKCSNNKSGGGDIGLDPEEGRKAAFWKKLTFFGAFPTIGLVATIVFMGKGDDEDKEERPPFVKYEYMRRRCKPYPWSDGVKTFFHNPKMNALPDGYKDD